MFKFNLEQIVWYLFDNKVCSAPILSRTIVENAHDAWASTNEQKLTYQPFGPSCVKYNTIHASFDEEELSSSKEELAAKICGT